MSAPAARLRVMRVGPHVSVQDGGRRGLMRFGVPASGPMDRKSFAIAHAALGNPLDGAAIEVSVGGLALRCEQGAVSVALAGGGFRVRMNEQETGSWSVLSLQAGDTLEIDAGPWGSWCYLAFAGDVQAGQWLGSSATLATADFGSGLLKTDRLITVNRPRMLASESGAPLQRTLDCPVWARPARSVCCVLGPQERFFDEQALALLASEAYELTHSYDRMGVRLRGPALMPQGALSIPSEPIVRGSVQVSGDGTPTVLLSDHQTTGGYPKICTLLSDDVDRLAQCRPRDRFRFELLSPAQAVERTRERAQQRQAYWSYLGVVR